MFDGLDRGYEVVYADPPWSYYDPRQRFHVSRHYPVMPTHEIAALPVPDLLARRAVIFLWATSTKLPDALRVMNDWGFYYRGVAYVWVKTRRDGQILNGRQGVRPSFTKPGTEFVLVGATTRRGRTFPLVDQSQGQVVLAPRGVHSEKPAIFRDRIVELLGDRKRVELFSRHVAPGWDAWGNEAGQLGFAGMGHTIVDSIA